MAAAELAIPALGETSLSKAEVERSNLKTYPDLKDSGVEWLGNVPTHWSVRPLKHWVVVNSAVLPEDTDPDYVIDYVDIGAVGTGHLVAAPQRMTFRDAPSRARRVVRPGDTLVSTVRTYLKAVWHAEQAGPELIASTGFAVLTPRVAAWPQFVNYVCQSQPFTNCVTANSVGVAYPGIAETKLGTLPVAVPPLAEQITIARVLDHATSRIDRYIRAKERLVRAAQTATRGGLLDEYRNRLIADVVTGKLDVRNLAHAVPGRSDLARGVHPS